MPSTTLAIHLRSVGHDDLGLKTEQGEYDHCYAARFLEESEASYNNYNNYNNESKKASVSFFTTWISQDQAKAQVVQDQAIMARAESKIEEYEDDLTQPFSSNKSLGK